VANFATFWGCSSAVAVRLSRLYLALSRTPRPRVLALNSQRRLSSKVSSLLQFLFLLLRAAQVAVYSR
jgi:hypothetical protein